MMMYNWLKFTRYIKSCQNAILLPENWKKNVANFLVSPMAHAPSKYNIASLGSYCAKYPLLMNKQFWKVLKQGGNVYVYLPYALHDYKKL